MTRRYALILISSLAATTLLSAPARASVTDAFQAGDCNTSRVWGNCDGQPDQASLEQAGTDGGHIGNWADLPGGTTSRPYVKSLSVTNSGSTVDLITNASGPSDQPMSATVGSVGVVISPTNLCDTGWTTGCYATPNRIGVALAYRKSTGQVGSNFDAPNTVSESSGPATITPIQLRSTDGSTPVNIDSNTVVDMTLALNTLGTTLHWSWLNGIPSYWATDSLGQATATVRVKFRLAQMPVVDWQHAPAGANYCTALPVGQCNLTQSGNEWLQGNMILSLDNTGDGGVGALFATEHAIIGSVDVSTDGSTGLPTLSFGMSGPHLMTDGVTARQGTIRGVIPAVSLVHDLSMPSLTDSAAVSPATTPTDLISVTRTGSVGSGDSALSEWTAASNGSDAVFLEVTGVTFSVPHYAVKAKAGTPKAPKVKTNASKVKFKLSQAKGGAVAAACKSHGCTITVFRVPSSAASAALVKVASSKVRKGKGFTVPFTIAKSKAGTAHHLIVVVRDKVTGIAVASLPVRW